MNRVLAYAWTIAIAMAYTQAVVAADATAVLQPASGSKVQGRITFSDAGKGVRAAGEVTGLSPGLHGFHLHEKGDCSAPDAESAGGHFNPTGKKHGGPTSADRHAGDFGNIRADASGTAKIDVTVSGISLVKDRPDSILGRGLVVHEQADDLKTDPSGNSGKRIACGVVKG